MVAQISPRELYRTLENGQAVCLLDVRQPWENELAALPGSLLGAHLSDRVQARSLKILMAVVLLVGAARMALEGL